MTYIQFVDSATANKYINIEKKTPAQPRNIPSINPLIKK